MTETWYVLENGDPADPNEVAPDHAGVLMHKSGVPVAIGPYGPKSRGMTEEEMKKSKQKPDSPNPTPRSTTKDMKPADAKAPYTTRESKAG